MRVVTGFNFMEDAWAWAIYEGATLVHTSPERYALESNALKAGHAWIIEANKVIDQLNNKEQSS